MFIPVHRELLKGQDFDRAVWEACNILSDLGISNYFHRDHPGLLITIAGAKYTAQMDFVNGGVRFIPYQPK